MNASILGCAKLILLRQLRINFYAKWKENFSYPALAITLAQAEAQRKNTLFKTPRALRIVPDIPRSGPHTFFPSFLKMTMPRGGTVIERE
jgi:hypothetical protein